MTIPSYETLMRPLLQICSDGKEHRIRDLIPGLGKEFQLSPEELAELLPSGRLTRFRSRVVWARSYLVQAGLLEATARGVVRITSRGTEALQSSDRIDNKFLSRYFEFQEFLKRSRLDNNSETENQKHGVPSLVTPEEALQQAFATLRNALIIEVHNAILKSSSSFFERIVVDVLQAMGYGGSAEDAATLLGGPGDGGVDGAIKEDKLGLDTIYVQAKKWAVNNNVGDSEVRNFIGALQLHRARKGVLITTSDFSKTARESAARAESRVVLINGLELAELMVVHDVGVSVASNFLVKKFDSDYFEE